MINLLKFKARTDDDRATGEERYLEYSKKVMPFLKESGGKILYMGKSYPTLIGPLEECWDHVVLIKYGSITEFMQMIQSEGYPHQIRSSALEDSRLIPSVC